MAPAKAGKSCIVSISGYPFDAGLYGECREIGVRNQVATRVDRLAEADEYFPVARAWRNRNAVRAIPNLRHKMKSRLQRRGLMENTWMCHNSEKAGQYKIRHTIRCVVVNDACQPFSIEIVTGGVGPMGVDKNVNVDENQGWAP